MFLQTLFFLCVSPLTALAHAPVCRLSTPSLDSPWYTCSSPPDPYVVHPSPGKGLGVFATHPLEPGSIIMREPPILQITPPAHIKGTGYPITKITQLVRAEYAHLPPASQREVSQLTHHARPEEISAQDNDPLGFIFKNNAYNTGTSIGLFPRIARINHSCRPNAGYYWSPHLGRRIVYATRDIAAGEEIFVSFIPLLLRREERQRKLDRYGFTCTCAACALPPATLSMSDERRAEIGAGFKAFERQMSLTVPQTVSAMRKAWKNAKSSLQLAGLVEEEGLADYYAMAYKIVAVSHARVEDWEKATVWANKGYKLRVMEDPESVLTREMFSLTSTFIENWERQLNGTQSP